MWAFFDKAFGLGYATEPSAAWIHGGSPWLLKVTPPATRNNPPVDDPLVYAIALFALMLTHTGDTGSLGRRGKALPLVQKNRWLE